MPNKIISLNESCLYKSAILISKLKNNTHVIELYKANSKIFFDISEFIDALDLLFVLEKIIISDDGVLNHA